MKMIQSICIEDVPDEYQDKLWPKLDVNGGNVISVDKDEPFSRWLVAQGFVFPLRRDWEWLVVFR